MPHINLHHYSLFKLIQYYNEAPSGRWARLDSSCIATAMNPCVSMKEMIMRMVAETEIMRTVFIYLLLHFTIINTNEKLINEKLVE